MVRRCIFPSFHFFVSSSRSVVDCAHIQAFIFFVSRSRSVARRVRVQAFATETLKITVGCPPCTYPSIRNKKLQTCWTPWSTQETRGLWARPPVLTPVPLPVIHSRTCFQSIAQKSPCVNTFLRPSRKNKNRNLLVTVWEPGQDTQNKDNGHVRQQRHP